MTGCVENSWCDAEYKTHDEYGIKLKMLPQYLHSDLKIMKI